MSRFTSHLGLCQLEYSTGRPAARSGRSLWYLAAPLAYEVGDEGSGQVLTVPAFDRAPLTDADIDRIVSRRWRPRGVTDLGSIPRLARWLVAPDDPAAKAFVLHDDGYVTLGMNWIRAIGRPATRDEVDRELPIGMKALGAASWKRSVVFHAVRLGGAGAWGS